MIPSHAFVFVCFFCFLSLLANKRTIVLKPITYSLACSWLRFCWQMTERTLTLRQSRTELSASKSTMTTAKISCTQLTTRSPEHNGCNHHSSCCCCYRLLHLAQLGCPLRHSRDGPIYRNYQHTVSRSIGLSYSFYIPFVTYSKLRSYVFRPILESTVHNLHSIDIVSNCKILYRLISSCCNRTNSWLVRSVDINSVRVYCSSRLLPVTVFIVVLARKSKWYALHSRRRHDVVLIQWREWFLPISWPNQVQIHVLFLSSFFMKT